MGHVEPGHGCGCVQTSDDPTAYSDVGWIHELELEHGCEGQCDWARYDE